MISLLLLSLACTDPAGNPDDSSGPGPTPVADLEATAALEDDIATVAWVTWSTETAGTSWVEYGPDERLGYSTVRSTATTTEHAVLLAGLPAASTWYWRAVSEVDGEQRVSVVSEITTGVAPRDLPRASVTSDDPSLAHTGYTVTTSLGDPAWVIIYAADGSPVWWTPAPEQSVIAQVRLTDDGTAVLYNVANLNFSVDVGYIRRMRLDGEVLSETRTVLGHHDFVVLPEGGFGYIAADIREWTDPDSGETYTVVGDAIVEVPEGATDDTPRTEIYNTWDHFAVDVDPVKDRDFYPQGLDWTHSNSLGFADGEYLLSVRKENSVVKVDRATGEELWQLGGVNSAFTLTDGRAFVGQHSPELTEAGFMLFDNGDVSIRDAYSEAVEYTLDEDGRTFTRLWSYDYGQRISSYLLGDVERLANGNTLVAWGSGGTITEVTPDGQMALQVSMPIGSAIGFTHHLDALGGVPQ